ncbi:MFS general substrate transporter [Coniochaeta ligniaria NRRL 30616]|uniref:MFS general substrate transporter n=1 Tax=Coniochaeta ligniaria NRRL 30616 TaxID=1408157 RepID=A0A1J7JS63_9PEZI|nr:MFS general substrate transporter [Coniochaeta ligniaria NRRL 30616]
MAAAHGTKDSITEPDISIIENASDEKDDTAYVLQPTGRPPRKTGLERRLVMKQDFLLVPLLCLTYFVTYLDRNSFGNARLLGLQKQLKLTDDQYGDCAQLFFVGYVLFMLPANIFLRWIRPYYLVGGAIVCFGTFLCGMSAAHTYGAVLGTRILIGAAQAFVQGIGMYSSLWYTRRELAIRGSLYYSTATLAGAFSGLIAYAVGKNLTVTGTGRAPWRWLLIIEGVIGIGSGLVVMMLLPPFPDKMRNGKNWLFTRDEIELAIERSSTFNTRGSKLEWGQVLAALKDPKTWVFFLVNGAFGQATSTVGVFLPSFIAAFGYTDIDAQLFSVIPYAVAFVALLSLSFLSDRINRKGCFVIAGLTSALIGYIMLLTAKTTVVKMVATCFVVGGIYTGVLLSVVWLGINNAGFTKRATTWAMAEIGGQIFSIVGTNVYKSSGSSYAKGHWVNVGFMIVAIFAASCLLLWYDYSNKKRDRILQEYAARGETHPHIGKSLEELYDFHINFRYTL